MAYEIDQSGKIEQTTKNTVVAISNDESKSVLIGASEKRKQGSQMCFRHFSREDEA